MTAMATAYYRPVTGPPDIFPEFQRPIFLPVAIYGIEHADDEKQGQREIEGDGGKQHHNRCRQAEHSGNHPGGIPDLPVGEGPGQTHPDPPLGAGPPDQEHDPQETENREEKIPET